MCALPPQSEPWNTLRANRRLAEPSFLRQSKGHIRRVTRVNGPLIVTLILFEGPSFGGCTYLYCAHTVFIPTLPKAQLRRACSIELLYGREAVYTGSYLPLIYLRG